MRNILKAETLERKFPLLAVEHGCIVSKDADLTVAFEVTLPEVYTVAAGEYERGVLVCGTGIGMAIAANTVRGVRAANVVAPEFAALAREHNDANVIALSGRFVSEETNERIRNAFLTTDFGGGRHAGRVEKIMALEQVERA